MQILDSERTGLVNPVGIVFSARSNAFQILEGPGSAVAGDLVRVSPFADREGGMRLPAAVQDPINLAYDLAFNRLFFFPGASNQLFEIRLGADGNPDPGTLTRQDIQSWGVQEPQGMTVDQYGVLFILDAVGPRIVRVEPGAGGDFASAAISEINLNLASPRGIASDPSTGQLHVLVPAEKKLYELAPNGEVTAIRNLGQFELKNPQGMVFAPSGDQTDDPVRMSLFLADGASAESTGQIVELSLVTPEALPAGITLLPASLVRTFNTSSWSNPSPDPGGIEYLPASGGLFLTDSEVEESMNGYPPAYWHGYNVFFSSLSGSLVGNCTTFTSNPTGSAWNNFSNEPTGLALNGDNDHLFFTKDGSSGRLYEVSPGGDGPYCSADDIVTIYNSENYLGETSTSGSLLRAYNLSFMGTQSNIRSDVVYAPGSQNPSVKSIYIASRGVDNNANRLENDGEVWEISLSSTPTPTPTTGPSPTPTSIPPVTDLIFADGFESGNLSAWSSSSTDSGDLGVTGTAAAMGSMGLRAVIDDNNSIYVNDNTPNAEARYRARFYFNPNSIPMVSGDTHYIFQGYAGTSTSVIRCAFGFYSGVYQVRRGLVNDSGTWLYSSWQTIANAYHSIEVDWRAASAAGANDGGLTVWIDGVQKAGLTGVDKDTRRVDRARLGATGGVDTGTRGTYTFDAFESRRQSYIGP